LQLAYLNRYNSDNQDILGVKHWLWDWSLDIDDQEDAMDGD
jgi:hypothetical protein